MHPQGDLPSAADVPEVVGEADVDDAHNAQQLWQPLLLRHGPPSQASNWPGRMHASCWLWPGSVGRQPCASCGSIQAVSVTSSTTGLRVSQSQSESHDPGSDPLRHALSCILLPLFPHHSLSKGVPPLFCFAARHSGTFLPSNPIVNFDNSGNTILLSTLRLLHQLSQDAPMQLLTNSGPRSRPL